MARFAKSRTVYLPLFVLILCLGVAANAFAADDNTSVAITAQSPSSTTSAGQAVTFTATVTNTSNNNGSPGGSVDFYVGTLTVNCGTGGATLLGSAPAQAGGGAGTTATFTSPAITSLTTLGANTIHACFIGNTSGNGWKSSDTHTTGSVTQTITAALTSTALAAPAAVVLGKTAASFTATVADLGSTGQPLSGIVVFLETGVPFGEALTDNGVGTATATFSTALLALGSHTNITASYFPTTANFTASSSSAVTQTVNARATSTALAALSAVTVRDPGTSATVTVTDTDTVVAGSKGIFADETHALGTARSGQTATLLLDGRVLVVGGTDGGGIVLGNTTAEMYTLGSGFAAYAPTTGSFTARTGAAAVLLNNGSVLIVGGSSDGTTAGALASAEIFDPIANSVTVTSNSLNTKRFLATATVLPNGDVVIAGGVDNLGNPLNTAEVFTPGATPPTTGTFTNVSGNLGAARFGHTATLLTTGPNAGAVLLAGGTGDTSAELYTVTGTTGVSNSTGSLNAARSFHAASRMPDGIVLLSGGTVGATTAVDTAELYDPYSGSFTSIAATFALTTRTSFTATSLDNGQVLIVGGIDNSPATTTANAEVYTPSYDPQGGAALSSDNGGAGTADTVVGCTLPLNGTGIVSCNGSVKANHVNSSTTHIITAHYAYPDWVANTTYGVGQQVLPTVGNGGGFVFIATSAGLVLGAAPSWPQSVGGTVTDGAVNWLNIGLPNPNHTASTSTTQNLTVNQVAVSLTAASDTKFFDGTTSSTGVVTLTGGSPNPLFPGDTAHQTFDSATPSAAPGDKTLTPTFILDGSSTDVTGDYIITPTTAAGTINSANLTVTADDQTRLYGAADPTFTATLSGFVNGETLGTSGVTGTASCTTTATATSNVGTYPITCTLGTLAASHYDFTPFVAGTLTITKAHLTVTADPQSKPYDGLVFAGPYTATLSGFANGETAAGLGLSGDLTGNVGFSGAALAATNVGSYAITPGVGSLAATNYDFTTFVDGTLTISKAHLTVTADNLSRLYGAANPTLTFTLSGFQNGETAVSAGVTGSPTLSTTATVTSSVAGSPYTITVVDAGTLAAANYDFPTLVNGQLTVNKAHLTVTADPQTRAYGAANPTLTYTLSGFQNGETAVSAAVTGSPTITTAATAASSVAGSPYAITVVDAGTLAAANYDFPNLVNGQLTVTKAHLTVTADPQSRLYGAADPTFTATLSGFVNGEVLGTSGVTGTASCTTVATATSSVAGSPYAINCTQGTLAAGNYDFTIFVPGNLTINQAHLTVTADPQTRAYGAANPTLTYTLSGFQNGETAGSAGVTGTPTITTAATATSSVAGSPYTITVVDAGTLAAANYDFPNLVNGQLTVTKAHLTITADPQSKTYDGLVFAGPYTAVLSGFVNSETDAGLRLSGDLTGNVGFSGAAITAVNAGSYAITPGAGSLSATNYDFTTFNNGTLTITVAHLTVTADPQARLYGAANPALTATLSGFMNGETLGTSGVTGTASCTTPAIATSPVAGNPYAITCTQGSLAATNYDFTAFVPGVLTIGQAHLTVTADNKTRIYGAANPTLTFTLSGFQNGETAVSAGVTGSPTLSTTATATSSVLGGPYPITVVDAGTLAAANYDFPTLVAGQLTITTASLTVTPDVQTKVYGSTFTAFTSVVVGLQNADAVTVNYASTGAAATALVGSYNITVPSVTFTTGTASDYAITLNTATGGLTVTKAPLTITANSFTKVAGTVYVFAGTEFTTSGLANADTVTSATLTSTGAVNTAAAGPYPIVISSPVGTGLSNYTITLVNGVLNVGAAPSQTAVDVQSVLTSGGKGAFTFTATVSPTQPSGVAPGAATVVFTMDGAVAPFSPTYTCTTAGTKCTATATAVVLPAGSHKITATYGTTDPNFASSAGSAAVTVASLAGTLTPGSTTTVTANINYPGSNITLTGYDPNSPPGLNKVTCVVKSAVTVALPPTCSVSAAFPVTVSSAAPTAGLTVNISTSSIKASLQPFPDPAQRRFRAIYAVSLGMPAIVFMGLVVPLGTIRRKSLRGKVLGWLGLVLVMAILLAAVGCGGGFANPNNNQPVVGAGASSSGNYAAVLYYTDASGTHALASVDFAVGQ